MNEELGVVADLLDTWISLLQSVKRNEMSIDNAIEGLERSRDFLRKLHEEGDSTK